MRHLIALIFALFALAIAACGGDDDDGNGGGGDSAATTSAPPASKQEFIEQADEICREGNEEIAEINDELDAVSGSQSEQFAAAESLLRDAADLTDQGIDDFRALEPPPGDEQTIDRFLNAAEDQSTYLNQMADAAAKEDAEEYQQAADRLQQVAEERRDIVEGYGFEVCGSQ